MMRVFFKIDDNDSVSLKCNSIQQANYYINKFQPMFEPDSVTIYFNEKVGEI